MKKETYNVNLKDSKGVLGSCPMPYCGGRMERLQHGQWACIDCRTLYLVSEISDEEMIEWFVD